MSNRISLPAAVPQGIFAFLGSVPEIPQLLQLCEMAGP